MTERIQKMLETVTTTKSIERLEKYLNLKDKLAAEMDAAEYRLMDAENAASKCRREIETLKDELDFLGSLTLAVVGVKAGKCS